MQICITSGNANGADLGSLKNGLSENTGIPATTSASSSRGTVVSTGSTCITLGWMIPQNVLDSVYRELSKIRNREKEPEPG